MSSILLIESSATLRHAAKRLIQNSGHTVIDESSFTRGLDRLLKQHDTPAFEMVVLGWPSRTDDAADELFTTLDDEHYRDLHVFVLSHEADSPKLAWVTKRARTALVLWDNYAELVDAIASLAVSGPSHDLDLLSKISAAPAIRVLFVDDSPTVRVNYRRILAQAGYVTDTASSVAEGMEKALATQYDIAIVDYYMPDGTGDSLCRMLRDTPQTAHITTAVITGTYSDKAIIGSLAAGAVECMFKNEVKDLFLARIDAMSRSIIALRDVQKDHKRLEGILSSVGDGVYGVDNDGNITFINPAAKEMLGYTWRQALIGKSAHALFHNAFEDGRPNPKDQCPLQQAYHTGEQFRSWATSFIQANGKPLSVECTVYPLPIDDKQQGAVVAFRDVTERKLLLEELKWQATHDSLTKLPNRSYFESQLSAEVRRLKRSREISCLLYLDLDRFKYINDTAGHSAGDQLLIAAGRQLMSRIRASDSLARIGGDEFAIIMRNITPEVAQRAAEQFRNILHEHRFQFAGKVYQINVSIGIAFINQGTPSAGEVLSDADIACYIAKGKGRNQCHIFEHGQDHKSSMDMELGWSARLYEALREDLFVLHYQPIVALADLDIDDLPQEDGKLWEQLSQYPIGNGAYHFEVLLRMVDSRGEFISPVAFLPTAERFNMMGQIDRWVIKHAIQALSELPDLGTKSCLSINLSGQSMDDDDLISYICELTRDYGIAPRSLLFEITETTAIANLDAASRFIMQLHKKGYQFALDDFGSGFSSFSHLKYLPVDEIKIDGLFVQGVLNDNVDRAIIQSIVQIAHSVGKRTVAEFVENAEVLRLLKRYGIDYVQGYYISKPQPQLSSNRIPTLYNRVGDS